ncbi:MAG: alpha-ketoglutarate-dependent dioxygenase AlkB [Chloroflexota bacterium]|nr:alpha-ketoglutarate-dependent dioxygenase AlkB [Chloroflexota bacterium]
MSSEFGGPPRGLVFEPAFLSPEDERALLVELGQLEFGAIVIRGVAARRTARHFGLDYDYEQRAHVEQAEPLPPWLEPLRDRCAALAGVPPEGLVEALVQRYPEGATIGWHRDAPSFGVVVGVSLGSSARLRFRRGSKGKWTNWELDLPPRSAYVLAGEARTKWQHSLPPTKSLRYSITFRTLERRGPT